MPGTSIGHRLSGLGLVLLLGVAGCSDERLREIFDHYTPHERYERRLRDAGLDQTALGRDWVAVAEEALQTAVPVSIPYNEQSYLDPGEAAASAYRVSLHRGQRLEVEFESQPDSSYRVFLDLFLSPTVAGAPLRRLASADSLDRTLAYLAQRDGDYLVRVQPELLRGGRYAVTILVRPSLRFPVLGRDTTAIRSRYGAPRDGGRRRHEGLDIFAPRGTPVVAAADGVVRSTRSNNLGGNVVWLRDTYGRAHYYAHLDRRAVSRGQRVRTGDTIGFVGNSGNARTTPTHLHFGLYQRGSFDPYPALFEYPTTTATFTGDPDVIGRLVRVGRNRASLRALPATNAPVLATLTLHTPLHVEAGSGPWYRVALPDGSAGFVAAELTEPIDAPVRRELVSTGAPVRTDPTPAAVALDTVAAGEEIGVLGAYDRFLLVRRPSGRTGWLTLEDVSR